ncbi:MAG: DUF6544 family protein [Bacteroidota bacterium]
MKRLVFFLVVFLHGLIHALGFWNAFHYGNLLHLSKEISKPLGLVWLLAAFLFILAAIYFLVRKNNWERVAILAIVFSQVVVFYSWKEAKYATIINFLILIIIIPVVAGKRFDNTVKREALELLSGPRQDDFVITTEMLEKLPAIVQRWLVRSGVAGKLNINFVRLKQVGKMRLKQDSKWMPFRATQYFSIEEPQFVWKVQVEMLPFITMDGRDRFKDGKGEMLIKLFALFNIASAGRTPRMNAATMVRYLAEITWFPTAALSNYLSWSLMDATTVKVTMTYSDISVTGIMQFTEEGDLMSFEADRFMGNGRTGSMRKWLVEAKEYKTFNGVRIAHKNAVSWKLASGDFNWADIEVTDLEYNKPVLYSN